MKSSKMLLLLAATMMSATANIVASENVPTPMVTDGVMDLEQYLFGDVDNNGQTILHKIAENCDNDDFTVRLKLFNFLENGGKSESAKVLESKAQVYNELFQMLPKELVMIAVLKDANGFVQIKDNNGYTALDITKKRNTLNPHKRCGSCIEFLEAFEKMNKDLNK